MAKAKKLPSGNYRCQIYCGTDENGKRVYKSFTAESKKEAELMAAEYAAHKSTENLPQTKTLADAMFEFNEQKKLISPSTFRGYESLRRITLQSLADIPLCQIDKKCIQKFIDEKSSEYSPKTLVNSISYLKSVLKYSNMPDIKDIKLPQKKKAKIHVITDKEMKILLKTTEGTELGLAIRLAAFIPARRSEICALTADDFDGDFVTINKAIVETVDHSWYVKEPKTFSSNRTVQLPHDIIELVPSSGNIISCSPNALYSQFKRLLKKLDMNFRFHDLRHYGATFLHAQGVPDKYIMQRGGWSNIATLQNIYTHCLPEKTDEVTQAVANKLSSLMD